ncbi:MAG: OmpA family protein [Devosia sp.]|nr:OmpA family protein [Devosia sp.]
MRIALVTLFATSLLLGQGTEAKPLVPGYPPSIKTNSGAFPSKALIPFNTSADALRLAQAAVAASAIYGVTADLAEDGQTIRLVGTVPTDALRARLAQTLDLDTSRLEVQAGGPPQFAQSLDFGLAVLARLETGRFALRETVMTVSGATASESDYIAALATVGQGTPDGTALALVDIRPPVVAPFTWSAEKLDNGTISLAGYIPDGDTRAALLAGIEQPGPDAMHFADGAPVDFESAALRGLGLLASLDAGTVVYDGAVWHVEGAVATDVQSLAAESAFVATGLAAEGWTLNVAVFPRAVATAPVTPPTVEPEVTPVPETVEIAQSQTTGSRPGTDLAQPNSDPTPTPLPVPPETEATQLPASADPQPLPQSGGITAPSTTGEPGAPGTPNEGTEISPPPFVPDPQTAVTDPADPQLVPGLDYGFSATRSAGFPIVLTGDVPGVAAASYFGIVAGSVSVDALTVATNPPADFMADAEAGLRALKLLTEGKLTLAAGRWTITGKATDDTARQAALALIANLPDAARWTITVDAPPAILACQATVTAVADRNEILFRSGSAELADTSGAALDELAADLAKCPDVLVYVEGHTDADGAEDLNLTLSVMRAEAVVDALVLRGVDATRLYAAGYGESLPLAPNDTAEGKRLNRRIAFTLSETEL